MTTLELKAEINKAVDKVPEILLPEILDHIKHLKQSSPDKEDLKKFIDKVFLEDDGLLRRLAE